MGRITNLTKKFRNRDLVFGFTTSILDPNVLRGYARDGVDFILFDLEHGSISGEMIAPYLDICRKLDIPTIVRVQDAMYHLIAKQIDMGADGILLPRTETLEQVRTAIDAVRFPPIGRKGCGGANQWRKGESVSEFQVGRSILIQIESPKGIENLPAILSTYGNEIAAVIIGPYDMSFLSGAPLDIHGEVVTGNIMKVIEICGECKTSCGIYCDGLSLAKKWRERGMNVLWTASDVSLLASGVSSALQFAEDLK